VEYKKKEEALDPLPSSCMVIAALTTSYARIHLYKAMAKLEEGTLQYVGKITLKSIRKKQIPIR